MTWAESLAANHTDGILILHRGRVAYERYFGALAADRQHLAFSVTKSFVATVAAMLIADGTLDDGATVVGFVEGNHEGHERHEGLAHLIEPRRSLERPDRFVTFAAFVVCCLRRDRF
jgi:hypothetical protein